MFKRIFTKLVADFKEASPTVKAFIVIGLLLIIGIILRWDTIVEEVSNGFNFFNTK
jgi:hypothetical protein